MQFCDGIFSGRNGPSMWTGMLLPVFAVTFVGSTTGDVSEMFQVADGWWAYALVLILAAIPWWEILLVIPPAIGIGLKPVPVAILAFLGNLLPIYLIIIVHGRITDWLERRREHNGSKSKRSKRASRLFTKYGLGFVALAAPIAIGVHLATVIVLLLDAKPRSVAIWMTVGIALWTVVITVSSVVGFGLLGII